MNAAGSAGPTPETKSESSAQAEPTRWESKESSEGRIITLLRRGDPQGIRELMDTFHDRLFGLAHSICNDQGDTEEVLQDVYMTALRKIGSFEGRASLYTWLHRVTENAALMKRRSKRQFSRMVSMDEMGPGFFEDMPLVSTDRKRAPHENLLQKELRKKLHNSMRSLPEIYRDVLYLRDVQGYSTKEAGRLLRLTPAAVKSRLHRSRLLLRKSLKEYWCEN